MALIKRTLSGITASFTKTLAELDAFIGEQTQRDTIAKNNVDKLTGLIDTQAEIQQDAQHQIAQANKVRAKIAALIE